jgi:hypothetical protein
MIVMKFFNPAQIVSCEITKEHVSSRFYVRPEREVRKFFGIVVELQDRMIGDHDYWNHETKEFTYHWDFLKTNSDRYEIVGDEVMCKAEVRLQFIDGQFAKYYFSTVKDAIDWAKKTPGLTDLDSWIQR